MLKLADMGGLPALRGGAAGGELEEERRENKQGNELFHDCDILSFLIIL